jgi:hypothetical protein
MRVYMAIGEVLKIIHSLEVPIPLSPVKSTTTMFIIVVLLACCALMAKAGLNDSVDQAEPSDHQTKLKETHAILTKAKMASAGLTDNAHQAQLWDEIDEILKISEKLFISSSTSPVYAPNKAEDIIKDVGKLGRSHVLPWIVCRAPPNIRLLACRQADTPITTSPSLK